MEIHEMERKLNEIHNKTANSSDEVKQKINENLSRINEIFGIAKQIEKLQNKRKERHT